jgi:hypothetical protein
LEDFLAKENGVDQVYVNYRGGEELRAIVVGRRRVKFFL